MSYYYINGKEYNEEQFRQYIENKKRKQLKKLEDIIYQKHYSDVEWFGEITEEQFYKDIKTAYNVMYLTEILDIDCTDKGYRIFNKIQVICCNSHTSSTPAMETYYSETIFKYNAIYNKFTQISTN